MTYQKNVWQSGDTISSDKLNAMESGIESVDLALGEKQDKGDYVVYQKFVGGVEPDERKTIQLRNFDSVSGVMTNGEGVNLVMVSKWDKADFGSSKLPFNVNSKDGVVTVNDEKVVVTEDKLEQYVKTESMNSALSTKAESVHTHAESDITGLTEKLETLATKAELGNKADKSEIADMATKTELSAKADTVHTHNESDITGLTDKLATLATKVELGDKADKSDTYTKGECDSKFALASALQELVARVEALESKGA